MPPGFSESLDSCSEYMANYTFWLQFLPKLRVIQGFTYAGPLKKPILKEIPPSKTGGYFL